MLVSAFVSGNFECAKALIAAKANFDSENQVTLHLSLPLFETWDVYLKGTS